MEMLHIYNDLLLLLFDSVERSRLTVSELYSVTANANISFSYFITLGAFS